jgi:hypothetical protein
MVRVTRIGASALMAFCLAFGSRSARGQAASEKVSQVSVLAIWTDDADDQADALTRAIRSRVLTAAGWALVETTQSFETLAIALRCPPKPDAACLNNIGEQLHANYFIWGKMAKARGEIIADVHLWRRGSPGTDDSVTYPETYKDPDDPKLRVIATRLFDNLVGSAAGATLVVHAGTGGGTVFVDGVRRGALTGGVAYVVVSAEFHRVEVRVPGFQPAAKSATAGPTGESNLYFTLLPAAFASTERAPREHSAPFPTRTVLGYTVLATGVGCLVAAGVEGLTWANDKSASEKDRASVPSTVSDVCLNPINFAAQDACQKSADAKNASALAWIFAGAGAVLSGTGAWLLLAGRHEPAREPTGTRTSWLPPVELLPVLGTRTQSLDVRIRF